MSLYGRELAGVRRRSLGGIRRRSLAGVRREEAGPRRAVGRSDRKAGVERSMETTAVAVPAIPSRIGAIFRGSAVLDIDS